jgi:hypothetical protein
MPPEPVASPALAVPLRPGQKSRQKACARLWGAVCARSARPPRPTRQARACSGRCQAALSRQRCAAAQGPPNSTASGRRQAPGGSASSPAANDSCSGRRPTCPTARPGSWRPMTRTSRRRSANSRSRRESRSCWRRERDGTAAIGPFRQLTWETIKESAAIATTPKARLIATSILHGARRAATEYLEPEPEQLAPRVGGPRCLLIWRTTPMALGDLLRTTGAENAREMLGHDRLPGAGQFLVDHADEAVHRLGA